MKPLIRTLLTLTRQPFSHSMSHRAHIYMTYSFFLRNLVCAFHASEMVAGFYGLRRSAIELPGDVNDSFLP